MAITKTVSRRTLREAPEKKLAGNKVDLKTLNDAVKLASEIGLVTVADVIKFLKNEANEGDTLYKALKRYRDELGDDFKIKVEECFSKLKECGTTPMGECNAKNTDTKLTEDFEDWDEMPPLLTFPYAVQLQKVKQIVQDSEEQDDSLTCAVTDVVNTEEWGDVSFFLEVHADECEEGEIGRYVLVVNYIDSQFDKNGDEFTGTDMVECEFRSAEELIDYINDSKFRDTFTADDPNTHVYVPATHNASKQGNIVQPTSVTPATTASNALITKTRAQQEAIVDRAVATKNPQAVPVTDVISHKRYGKIQFYFVYNPRGNNYCLNVFYIDKPSLNFNSAYGTGFKYFNTRDELLDYIDGSEFKTRFLECYTKLGECSTKKLLKEDKFYISDKDLEDDFTRLMHFLTVSGYTETDQQYPADAVRAEAEDAARRRLEAEAEEADELNIPFYKDIAKEVAIAGERAVKKYEKYEKNHKPKIKALLSVTEDGLIKLLARSKDALDTAREIAADFDCPIEQEYETKVHHGLVTNYIMVINPYCGYEYGTPECDAAIAKWTPANQKVYSNRRTKGQSTIADATDDLVDEFDDDEDDFDEGCEACEDTLEECGSTEPLAEGKKKKVCADCGKADPNLLEELDFGWICPVCARKHRRLGESLTFIKRIK